MSQRTSKTLCLMITILVSLHRAACDKMEKGETSKAALDIPKDYTTDGGPSELLKKDLSASVDHEIPVSYPEGHGPSHRVTSVRRPRNNDYSAQQMVIIKPGKVKPGHYAGKTGEKAGKRKNYNWKLPESLKGVIPSEADSKISWSYWETDDNEFWPDDADDSKPPAMETTPAPAPTTTTTTTTTTPAPTTKGIKGPISIHKHFHYLKKGSPWKMPMPMPMPPEEMMMMTEELMNEMMMKGMVPDSMHPSPPTKTPDKKGISGVLHKLSEVDPVTVLVAGIIPASLILAAVIPSVMKQMMNKGDAMNMMPPMMPPMMMPMVTTTAMGPPAMDMMSSRRLGGDDGGHPPLSMTEVLREVGSFGRQALRDPRCAKRRFCELARRNLVSDAPEFQRALEVATISMKDSWLDSLGVRDILHSLVTGTCDTGDCKFEPDSDDFPPVTQPTPPA